MGEKKKISFSSAISTGFIQCCRPSGPEERIKDPRTLRTKAAFAFCLTPVRSSAAHSLKKRVIMEATGPSVWAESAFHKRVFISFYCTYFIFILFPTVCFHMMKYDISDLWAPQIPYSSKNHSFGKGNSKVFDIPLPFSYRSILPLALCDVCFMAGNPKLVKACLHL